MKKTLKKWESNKQISIQISNDKNEKITILYSIGKYKVNIFWYFQCLNSR